MYTVACVAKCTFFIDGAGTVGAEARLRLVRRWGTGDNTVELTWREDEDEEDDVEDGEDPGVDLELPLGASRVEAW